MIQRDVRQIFIGLTASVVLAILPGCDTGSSGDSAGSGTSKKAAAAASTEEQGLLR